MIIFADLEMFGVIVGVFWWLSVICVVLLTVLITFWRFCGLINGFWEVLMVFLTVLVFCLGIWSFLVVCGVFLTVLTTLKEVLRCYWWFLGGFWCFFMVVLDIYFEILIISWRFWERFWRFYGLINSFVDSFW